MTYYGRWVYKYEEMSRRGAVGALIIHETAAAGYGWNVIESPQGENYEIQKPDDQITSLKLQGWISGDAASSLFKKAGLDLGALRKAARRNDFRPVAFNNSSFSASYPIEHEIVMSQNVLAKITGSTRPDEVIMYGAHWDAYGEGPPDKRRKKYIAQAQMMMLLVFRGLWKSGANSKMDRSLSAPLSLQLGPAEETRPLGVCYIC